GKFTEDITDYKGLFVKDADKAIIKDLKDRNLLYKRSQIIHNYPFCWRCKSPLIYYARSSWYIKTSEFKQNMIDNNNQVNWFPSFVGEKRFGDWLENNIDWALSRDRFWGTPLNIWKCECGEMVSIGSISELREKGTINGSFVPEDIELHRPYVDKITIDCPKCKQKITRTPEVIDCWFDSGAMPFAQWHYPFENKEIFESELFPADFICEGIDQTRGWFYTLLAISTFLKNQSPYKNVLVNDLILDKKGQKMSKTLGNSVNPMELMQSYGADAIRWYLLVVSPPWTPTKFNTADAEEVYGKFIGTLKNVLSFYITYAKIDNFMPDAMSFDPKNETEIDSWIYSKLHSLIALVCDNNEKYDFTRSLRAIQKFVIDDLSNWYVRRSRRRYWAMELTEDKKAAYFTLYSVLVDLSKLIAPFAPFIAEEIYTSITFKDSVHLEDYPKGDPSKINKALENEMDTIIDLISMGRAARNQAQIKVRQPLQALYVPEKHQEVVLRMKELIYEEINVKEVILLADKNDTVTWVAKLNMKTAGPKFGKDIKQISTFLESANISEILGYFKEKKEFTVAEKFVLTEEDIMVSIAPKEGYCFENNHSDFVALDTRLTDDLVSEGYARELVNKIQFTRKENDFEIMDRIVVTYCGDKKIKEVFESFADYIAAETLANKFIAEESPVDGMAVWDINGLEMHLKIERLRHASVR
ncbi:MAG: class I tRNA ligase family protein, partial [Candidatus Cloacimonetes bacterium]|nr:class I tRNA ligase family protein [Candidatus Cloacimonadota bacterium]